MNIEEKEKEKAIIFKKASSALGFPMDNTSALVLLRLSSLIDKKGGNLTMDDLENLLEPFKAPETSEITGQSQQEETQQLEKPVHVLKPV